jgi:hypothetical protein
MRYINFRYILMLNCLLAFSLLNGCRSGKSVAIGDGENVFTVAGEIKLEEPVNMYIEIRNKTLSLITTKTNAIRFSRKELDLDGLMRLDNVYFSGENPLVFDEKHFRKYPGLGMDAVGVREILSQDVQITHITTNCFLVTFIDHKTYQQTQLGFGVSYFFESKNDWVFLKFAFTMTCSEKKRK